MYFNFLLLLFGVTAYFEARFEYIERVKFLPHLVVLVLLFSYAARSTTIYKDLRLNRSGYLAAAWYKSDVLKALAEVPPEAILYTNDPQALYFISGRTSLSIPVAIDTVIQQEREDYSDLLAKMQREIRNQCGALVLFNSVRLQTQYGPEETISSGLEIGFFDPSVRIYRSPEGFCPGAES